MPAKLLHGFELIREQDIPELRSCAWLFRHQKTGARLLSLENNDENKVFGISFKTPPRDSTGVAHILEHTVLHGSHKYPVKEPFVELMKASVNTFLNAFTYPDKTCYPIASQNLKDFYNLMDVYLDCVFHPLLQKEAFETEGWHYEFSEETKELVYKGIVFNEMKGVYSDPKRIVNHRVMESLFPDTLYSVSSGGDPAHIPDLTHEQFVAFHQRYYHPSNSYIYFWGDDPAEERLKIMNFLLSKFKYLEPTSAIALQTRFSKPRQFSFPYPAGEGSAANKARIVVNWMLAETQNDAELHLSLILLHHILFETPASPVRKALLDSKLGEELENGIDADDELYQKCFSTGLRGVALEDAQKIEPLILNTLEILVRSDIDPKTVASSLNTIEFKLREIKPLIDDSHPLPQGLLLMTEALGAWLHDGDPIDRIAFAQPLEKIKNKLKKNPRYFEDLIQKYLLQNPHRTCVILIPDANFSKEKEEIEKKKLSALKQSCTEKDIQAIAAHTEYLKKLRETPDSAEALATIPKLSLKDIGRKNKKLPCAITQHQGRDILFHNLPTNDILYLDLGFDLGSIPEKLLPLIPLFGKAILGMDTKKRSYVELSQVIGSTTGGIETDLILSTHFETKKTVAQFLLRGKCLASNVRSLIELLEEIRTKTRFTDPGRLKQLALQRKTELEEQLLPKGHVMLNRRLRSRLSTAGWLAELMNGFEQILFIRKLIDQIEIHGDEIRTDLEQLREILFSQAEVFLNVTCDDELFSCTTPFFHSLLEKIPLTKRAVETWASFEQVHPEGFSIPSQVNYVGKAFSLEKAGYSAHGSALVIKNFLHTNWFWDQVRVRGGAYGCMCAFDRPSGILSFFSYRDPNLTKTLRIFDETAQFLKNADIAAEETTKSIIGTIGDIDTYLLPQEKGYASLIEYLTGDTKERRQKMRDEILGSTRADFRTLGEYLEKAANAAQTVVLGSKEAIKKADRDLAEKISITPIL